MAFTAETVTTTKIGMGPIILKFNGSNVGRIVDFEIETTPDRFEIVGGSEQQIVDVIRTSKGTGKIRVTLDEVHDIDGTIDGAQTTVTLEQEFPKGSDAGWRLTAATADSAVLSMSGNRNATPTSTKLEITPYAAVGSDPWTFTDTQAY